MGAVLDVTDSWLPEQTSLWVPLVPLTSTPSPCPQPQDMGHCYDSASLEGDTPLSAARKVASYTLFLV